MEITSSNLCFGCTACVQVCPKSAITMIENNEGFLYPQIDENKCTNCGICKNICPNNKKTSNNTPKPIVYAAMASDDIRKQSSSGGAFSIIAKYVFDKKGYVCGCTFDTNERIAKHIIIDTEEDLYKLRGSKYLQSELTDIYIKIKELLNSDKYALFSGTPCQVAGLKSFLKKEYAKLITIDILCHGVGSPKVYKKYLSELITNPQEELLSINFRDKANGWLPPLINNTNTNKNTYRFSQLEDLYLQAFLKNICLRKSCGNCKYCTTLREGDITLGDFWRIEEYNKKLNDNKGTSLILVNNEKAEQLIQDIKDNFSTFTNVPLDYAIIGNRNLHHPSKIHKNRDKFFNLLNKYSLKQLINLFFNKTYDCAIMNYWASWNYGAILTCYALQEAIKDFGYTTQVINYRPKFWENKKLYPQSEVQKPFINKYLNISKKCKTKQQLKKLNSYFNTFIIGSDQVWCWWYALQYVYFGDFINDDKKKIACSASVVFENFHQCDDVKTTMGYYINKFDFVSVREKSAVDTLKNEFNIQSTCIIDPVFWIDKNRYIEIANTCNLSTTNFVVIYMFNLDNKTLNIAKEFAQKNNLNIVIIQRGKEIENWLYYFKNASYVFTDSYHGVCFSVIFEKDFIAFTNGRGNSRFESLFSILNLKERLIDKTKSTNIDEIINKKINYKVINNILSEEKNHAEEWIKNALETPKDKFKESWESKFINVLLNNKKIPKGYPNFLYRYKKILINCLKKTYRKTQAKLYLLTKNTYFLK